VGRFEMKTFSEFYANCYDEIHSNKNYREESFRLERFIQRKSGNNDISKLLDYGCGTGGHLLALEKDNRELAGFDISRDMLKIAKLKKSKVNFTDRLDDLGTDFDLVYSLFDVINYQVSKQDLTNFIYGVDSKLRQGGYFVCDGWNLEGVRLDPPKVTSREFIFGDQQIIRRVEPSFEDNFRISNLKIELYEKNCDEPFVSEIHRIRAYEPQEIAEILVESGFIDIKVMDGADWDAELNSNSWKFALFARKSES
jgi:SAM-dependent methyltransferase